MGAARLLEDDPVLKRSDHFEGARTASGQTERLESVRQRARTFREQMLAGAPVRYYKSVDLIGVPYPRRFGLREACRAGTTFIRMINRLFIVQLEGPSGVKTLLVSPSDTVGARKTPFFARLEASMSWVPAFVQEKFGPTYGTVEGALAEAGITPEQVDYITYDHLHTQDLRKWLGTRDGSVPAYFPNATLLVTAQEWHNAGTLLPTQADWYCPGGTDVPLDRVLTFDGDLLLGEGVALVRTPGHTEGNHSIVTHTDDGLLVTSENGVSPDAYAPQHSDIPGLKEYAALGNEVVLNGNTLESSVDQYISMVMEKEIAGPCPRDERFFNVVPSSELTAFWAFRGVKPSFQHGTLEFGSPVIEDAAT